MAAGHDSPAEGERTPHVEPSGPRLWRGLGLRSRFVVVILLTSAVTLAAAAIAVLSPLDRSLREDELDSLTASAQAARGTLGALPPRELRAGSHSLRRAAVAIGHRAEARVAIVGPDGTPLFHAPGYEIVAGVAGRALRQRTPVREIVSDRGSPVALVGVRTRVGHGLVGIALRRSLVEASSATAVVRRAFAVGGAIALALGLVLGIGLATTLLRRLRRLRDAVHRVGAHGLEARIPSDSGRDEVADLNHAFRQMQVALRRQEDARKAFVATASHELRTPITSLHGMLELLDADLSQPSPDLDDARLQLAGARRQSARLVALARDLLDLSRLDAGSALRSEPVELVEVSRAVLAEFELRAQERSVELVLDGQADSCWSLADPGSVARIVRILVDNALRYSPPGEPIRIEVHPTPAIVVADSGPGVPPELEQSVFERFSRGPEPDRRADDSGFGLGLAIGRELARQMGGDLVLARDGRPGARFELRLPPYDEPPEVPAQLDDAQSATAHG